MKMGLQYQLRSGWTFVNITESPTNSTQMNSSAPWRPSAQIGEGTGDGVRIEVHWQKGLSNSRSGIAGQDRKVSAELFAE